MKTTELLVAELDRESVRIRKVIERVPEGKNDWKPHPKSMTLGALATLVANIPAWVDMIIKQDSVDVKPVDGPKYTPQPWAKRSELIEQFEASLKKGRQALENVDESRLFNTRWKLLAAGHQLMDVTRYEALRDTVLNHMAHHRGQLTVYLRLNEVPVPAIYGASADEPS
jgi:uncharacterized damage-inducible protein DinB